MSPDSSLPLEPLVTNVKGYGEAELPDDPANIARNAALNIRLLRGGESFWINALGSLFPPPQPWAAEIPLDPITVFGHVEDCRHTWQSSVVDHQETVQVPTGGQENRFPFQDAADLSARPQLLAGVLPALAVAGDKLFFHLFEDHPDEELRRLAARLREVAAEHELVLTITSNRFFIPWNLVYTHPKGHGTLAADGSNARPDGFWGYRHIIEHNPQWIALPSGIKPAAGKIRAGINIDERLDKELNVKCIEPQLAFLAGLPFLAKTERRQRALLEADLSGAAFADQIMYFCCHGSGGTADGVPNLSKAQVALTDGQPIRGDHISYWLRDRDLTSHPFVFVNACQGGQMTTMFYETLATELLRRHAVALVGTQIDIPAVFAADYAISLFTRFFKNDGAAPVRLGPLLRGLSRDMIDKFANPLGLVYSLYRGIDCHVAWA